MLGSLFFVITAAPALAQAPAAAPPALPSAGPHPEGPRTPRPPVPALSRQQLERAKLNQETLIIAASRPGTAYLAMANDLTAAIGTSGNVRVLPLASDGGPANLKDVLLLRGIDMAIVPTNVLAHAKTTKAFGNGVLQRIAYVTALYSEEVHVVAGQGIAAVGDLHGKRVAVPLDDGTAQFTARDIFQRLGIAVDSVSLDPANVLEEVRTGAVAAAVLVGGKPLVQVSALPKDGRLRLLSLPLAALPGEGYSPAVLLSEDYPPLVPPGAMVETVAVSAVLVASKGSEEAVRRVAKHTPVVLDAIARLAVSQRHPKWKDVNLGVVLPGWSRLEAAEAWLARAFAQRREVLQGHFDEFLSAENRVRSSELSAPRRKKLFDEFEAWARKSVTGEPAAK